MGKEQYHAAMYLRLSRDDVEPNEFYRKESNSIGTQRSLIEFYLRQEPQIDVFDCYVDDGYTGSNFDRPAFRQMLHDVQSGFVNCIIVKDLSRFGRDYIETGRYIQKIFPTLGIRFIAITDGYDSEKNNQWESAFTLPVKNFLNDAYCRDSSVKVRSQQRVRRSQGDCISSFVPYGYQKDPENHHKLKVDAYAAVIVKKIFKECVMGKSAAAIARELNKDGVLSPFTYKQFCGEQYYSGYHGDERSRWHGIAVSRILTNEIYTGTLVQGRREKINYKMKKVVTKPENQWVKVANTHDAIVDIRTFRIVQKQCRTDVRAVPNQKMPDLFAGMLFCADCRQSMVRRLVRRSDTKLFYMCSTKNRAEGCTRHSIEFDVLQEMIRQVTQLLLQIYIPDEDRMQLFITHEITPRTIQIMNEHVARLIDQQQKYHDLYNALEGDFASGLLSKEDYKYLNSWYTNISEIYAKSAKSQRQMIQEGRIFTQNQDFDIIRGLFMRMINRVFVYENKCICINLSFRNEWEEKCLEYQGEASPIAMK